MNYLGHLYLSDTDDLHRLGNIAGDWVKGPLQGHDLPARVLEGVRRHRWVDGTTDRHPAVREAHRLFSPERRRAVPIIMDMMFDHFLAVNWSDHSDIPLNAFLADSYAALNRTRPHWPVRARRVLPGIIERDLLGQYRDIQVIAHSLERIADRVSRDIGLRGALPEIQRNLTLLEDIHVAVLADLEKQLKTSGIR
ncbi:MAG: ACP phosphodiesterase [Aquisalimonadaceae bacterium]